MAEAAKTCSVLLINPDATGSGHRDALERAGFRVTEATDFPERERAILDYHIVIVRVRIVNAMPMLAARLRAKPLFGRRILVALVTASLTDRERDDACTSGFDDVLVDRPGSRQLITRILKILRVRPELQCLLLPPDKRRSAA